MPFLQTWMGDFFWWVVGLALLALIWTVYIFSRRRYFQDGPKKGVAKNPAKVRRENPPDPPKSASHHSR